MNTSHLNAFLDAMHRRDPDGLAAHLADDVVIHSPIVLQPFTGKAQVQSVLTHLIRIVDSFEVRDTLHGPTHSAVMLDIRVGTEQLNGVDYLHLNADGLIDSMMVMWRPLAAVVSVQNRLAAAIGIPALRLVEAATVA